MPSVDSKRQTTRAYIQPGETAGGCEFCPWAGEWIPIGTDGILQAAADAREHLGEKHPEKVTYWEDLL